MGLQITILLADVIYVEILQSTVPVFDSYGQTPLILIFFIVSFSASRHPLSVPGNHCGVKLNEIHSHSKNPVFQSRERAGERASEGESAVLQGGRLSKCGRQ